ncbi:MAG: 5-demethoxyubiquinol-8 5-hydroxylase UbiM [Xanthomonadales bacterium]|nr:5-demethoxyubiquinol-8 5-hydroxylase UbiM [Xanthomonadales bacterium]
MNTDVVVAGAGPSGLSLAIALSQAGLRVSVVDPADEAALSAPPDDGREIALTPLSQSLLRQWGQWQRLETGEQPPLREARVFDGSSLRPMTVSPPSGQPQLGWMVSNHALRRVAYAQAQAEGGIDWYLGRRLQHAGREADAAVAVLDDGERIPARLIVAADSRFSSTRRAAGIPARMHDFGRSMLVCRMRLQRPQPGVAWEWLDYGQTLALLPLGDNLASVVITLPPSAIDSLRDLPEAAFNDDITRRFRQRLGTMELVGERFAYPLVGVHPERCVARRFACIGDAAVGMHPITAHGYNLALRGIALLADRLRGAHGRGVDIGDDAVLDAFQHEFRAITRPLFLATQGIVQLYGDDRLPARVLRRAGLRFGQHFPPFRRLLARTLDASDPRPPPWMRVAERLLWRTPRPRSD